MGFFECEMMVILLVSELLLLMLLICSRLEVLMVLISVWLCRCLFVGS